MAAKGYWIVGLDVADADQYAEYVKLVRPYLSRNGGRFLVRGGQFEAVEGAGRSRNIVIEFPDYQTALSCYRSAEYQNMVAIRSRAAEGHFVVVEGLDD